MMRYRLFISAIPRAEFALFSDALVFAMHATGKGALVCWILDTAEDKRYIFDSGKQEFREAKSCSQHYTVA